MADKNGVGAGPSTVLVVDDEESIRDYLSSVLSFEGYECRTFSGPLPALAYLSEANRPADLMLADINMPGMNGLELLRNSKAVKPDMPVILVSGLYELALALEALESGADDYLKKPVRPSDVVTLVDRYLQGGSEEKEEAIREALEEYVSEHHPDPETSLPIQTIFNSLGFKRYETFQHSKRVAAFCRLFGERRGLSKDALDHLELGALLHDIGKIGIPRNVLLKPGPLNDEEWEIMRNHPNIGFRLLSQFPALTEEAEIVLSHHESFNGKGYPRGLAGEEIPLGARLFSIVDTFDAITSDRPYRKGAPSQTAFEEIERMSGTQFDPDLAQIFLQIPEPDLQAVRRRYPDDPPPTADQAAAN